MNFLNIEKHNQLTEFKPIEEDIQGALVQNYLSEKSSAISNTEIFSSSDTVNELLQGLTSEKREEIIELGREECEILPTFSKILDSSNFKGTRTKFIT